MKNAEIAEIFNNIADILEITEENRFRIRAYRNAALALEGLTEDVEAVAKRKELEDLPGIGKDLAGKIAEYVESGRMKFYEDLKKSVPGPVLKLMGVPGIGPRTAKLLCEKFKIKSVKELEKKASSGKIKNIFGIKEKTVANILRGIDFLKKSEGKITLDRASGISREIAAALKKVPGTKRVTPAGSLRRMKETVRDIDILAASKNADRIMSAFVGLARVKSVVAHGRTKSSVITGDKVQVDLRIVDPENFGSALLYFTGSKNHNIRLREMAVKKGLKINEYGIFRKKTGKRIAGTGEKGMYEALGLDYIEPELREDKGEVKLALEGKLPRLVTMADIRGDFHGHSHKSDGYLKFGDIAGIAAEKGYEYITITDHSKSLKVAGGLSEKELLKSVEEIRKLNRKLSRRSRKAVRVLAGSEVDILSDGSLDYPDSVLKELDFVIGAIHTGFKQPRDVITKRVLKAMDNKYVNMIAHPTGRLIGIREAYEIDLERIFKAAKETNTALEINSYPERLDLTDDACRRAKELGAPLAIGTDSHQREHFGNMLFGVSVARRGWLEKKNLLNTLPLDKLLKKIRK